MSLDFPARELSASQLDDLDVRWWFRLTLWSPKILVITTHVSGNVCISSFVRSTTSRLRWPRKWSALDVVLNFASCKSVGWTCKTWIFEVNIHSSTSKTAAFIISSGSQSGWHVWQPCCTCWEVYQRYSVCFESSNETWTSLGYASRPPQCRIGETSETWPLKSFKWYVEICNVECVRVLMCFVF